MNFLDSLKTVKGSLTANKIRSLLTMLGIIIGTAAVIIIMALGAGAQSLILNQIKSAGSNLISIFPGASEEKGPPSAVMGITITTLTYDDAKALEDKNKVPHLKALSALTRGIATISWQNRKVDTSFVGTTASYPEVRDTKVALGRFFNEPEERNIARVVVLGSLVRENLFGERSPLGQKIKIRRETFEVIGVMEERGVSAFQNQDDRVFVPLTSAQKLLLGINHISLIQVKVDDQDNITQTIADIKATLRARHYLKEGQENDFTVRTQIEALQVLTTVTDALRLFLVAMAAISLLVGGIGIMNIMLVSVSERTREIGLRKAIGARQIDLLGQFLTEAVVVTLAGGVVGIIIGGVSAGVIALVLQYLDYDWDLVIRLDSIILAAGVSVLVGLVFGLYPAQKAARMDPVEALRYE